MIAWLRGLFRRTPITAEALREASDRASDRNLEKHIREATRDILRGCRKAARRGDYAATFRVDDDRERADAVCAAITAHGFTWEWVSATIVRVDWGGARRLRGGS